MPAFRQPSASEPLILPLTLESGLGSLLDRRLDLVVGSRLLKHAGEIDHGNVGGRHTHGHASELAIERWDDLADSLGRTSAAGDDVLSRSSAAAPVFGRWAVDSLLGSSVRVNGGHETFLHPEVVVDDLGERGQAVGGARGVGDDGDVGCVGFVVDTHDEHGSIRRWSGNDHLLRTALQVGRSLLGGGEDTGGLDNVVGSSLGPWDLGGISLHVELDLLAIDDQGVFANLNCAFELSVCAVILEHVCLSPVNMCHSDDQDGGGTYGVLGLNERIVHSHDSDIVVLDTGDNVSEGRFGGLDSRVGSTHAFRKTCKPVS